MPPFQHLRDSLILAHQNTLKALDISQDEAREKAQADSVGLRRDALNDDDSLYKEITKTRNNRSHHQILTQRSKYV